MFDKLIEVLIEWWNHILPFIIIRDYEQAVLLRFGKFNKVLLPGIHFKIPFFDEAIDQHVVVTTLSLDAQSLEECTDSELDNILTKKVRVEARKWGVEVQQVTLTDLAPIRSYRLINDNFTNKLD